MDMSIYNYKDLIVKGDGSEFPIDYIREYPLDMYSTKDVVDHFGYERLIDEIGIEKVELYLRKLKIEKLRKNV